MSFGNVEVKGLSRIEAVENLFVSGTITTSGSMQLGQTLVDGDSDLILSSSATSNIVVSGNLNVLGTLSNNGSPVGGSGEVTGSTNFFTDTLFDARGRVSTTRGSLSLSGTQVVVTGSAFKVMHANGTTQFQVDASNGNYISTINIDNIQGGTNGNTILRVGNISATKRSPYSNGDLWISGKSVTNGILYAESGIQLTGSITNLGGHLILSSSAGSIITASGTLRVAEDMQLGLAIGKRLYFGPSSGLNFITDENGDRLRFYAGNTLRFQVSNLADSHVILNGTLSLNSNVIKQSTGHMILTCSDGSTVAVSGNIKVTGAGLSPLHAYRHVSGSGYGSIYIAGLELYGGQGSFGTANPFIQNTIRTWPFLSPSRVSVIDQLSLNVASFVASSYFRIGIYTNTSYSNLYPDQLLTQSDDIDSGTNGIKTWGVDLRLAPNTLYWIALVAASGSATFSSIGMSNAHASVFGVDDVSTTNQITRLSVAYTYTALPSTFPAGAAINSNQALIKVGLRYSA